MVSIGLIFDDFSGVQIKLKKNKLTESYGYQSRKKEKKESLDFHRLNNLTFYNFINYYIHAEYSVGYLFTEIKFILYNQGEEKQILKSTFCNTYNMI